MGRSRRLRLALLLAVGLLGPVPLLSAQSRPVTGPEERGLDSDGPAEPPAERPTESNEVREFQISAERFAFTPNAIEVKECEKVRLVIWSNDVTHGFAIKKLDIDEVIPQGGEPVTIEFVAAEAGRFPFECSLYCGRGHEGMTGILTVAPRTAEPGPVLALPPPEEAYPGEFDDLSLDLAQPDFTLITLPTTLRVPRYRAAFRVTHRFGRALGAESLSLIHI